MRKFIALIAIAISLTASAQEISDTATIDTSHIKFLKVDNKTVAVKDLFKKDTVAVPVYIIEKTDTAEVKTLLYEGKGGRVYKSSPGYYVYKQQVATTDDKNYRPFSQPVVIGALDDRKRPVKPLDN